MFLLVKPQGFCSCQATVQDQQKLNQSMGNLPAAKALQALCPQQEALTMFNCLNYYCGGKLAKSSANLAFPCLNFIYTKMPKGCRKAESHFASTTMKP